MFARIVCLVVLTLSAPAFADGILPKLSSPKVSPSAATSREPAAKGPSIDERILFQPTVFPKGYYDRKPETVEDIEFASADKTSLHGWFSKAASPKAVVLYCHGNAGNVSVYGRFLERLRRDHRLTVLAFDYRGYGKSGGKPTAAGVVEDGKAARKELARLAGVREDEVVV
jgi:pimeloyl-ACP methyl ester carboxylesterase